MNWQRISRDSISAAGYLICRVQDGERTHYAAWRMAPQPVQIAAYWGESAEAAKAACAADMAREGQG